MRAEADGVYGQDIFRHVDPKESSTIKQSVYNEVKTSLISIIYFYKKISCNIEILCNDENIIIHFPILPACTVMSEAVMDEYRKDCTISDSNSKMTELMSTFKILREGMRAELQMYRTSKFGFYAASEDAFKWYLILMWIVGLLENLTILISLKWGYDDSWHALDYCQNLSFDTDAAHDFFIA